MSLEMSLERLNRDPGLESPDKHLLLPLSREAVRKIIALIGAFELLSQADFIGPYRGLVYELIDTAELLSEAIARDVDEVSRDEQDSDSIFVAILNSITPIPEESEFE